MFYDFLQGRVWVVWGVRTRASAFQTRVDRAGRLSRGVRQGQVWLGPAGWVQGSIWILRDMWGILNSSAPSTSVLSTSASSTSAPCVFQPSLVYFRPSYGVAKSINRYRISDRPSGCVCGT